MGFWALGFEGFGLQGPKVLGSRGLGFRAFKVFGFHFGVRKFRLRAFLGVRARGLRPSTQGRGEDFRVRFQTWRFRF